MPKFVKPVCSDHVFSAMKRGGLAERKRAPWVAFRLRLSYDGNLHHPRWGNPEDLDWDGNLLPSFDDTFKIVYSWIARHYTCRKKCSSEYDTDYKNRGVRRIYSFKYLICFYKALRWGHRGEAYVGMTAAKMRMQNDKDSQHRCSR